MKVILDYDPVWTALSWAKENCPSYITNQVEGVGTSNSTGNWSEYKIAYYFGKEEDATLFALKWK